MKQYFIIIGLLIAVFVCCSKADSGKDSPDPTPAAIDYVKIPDANFKTYLLENFDADKDGGISADEAKKVSSIDCSSKGISSLSGIRCFTELKTLNCSGNSITTLVLTDSKSTKADVPEGNCDKLVSIDCSNNQITSITIDGCSSLTTLNCSSNQLTSLDVSNNQNLSTLNCSGNENLSEVIVSENQTIDNVKKDEGTKIKTEDVHVESVFLNKSSLELSVGDTGTLSATVKPDNATNKNVTWSSSDQTIASVDSGGTVTAVKAGSAKIVATTEDGKKTAECSVTVKEKVIGVEGVSLDKSSIELEVGEEMTLVATIKPDNATNKNVSWSSSDGNIVSVSDGKVKAIKEGSATITVTTSDGGKTATCAVTVSGASNLENPGDGETYEW